jgi:hypothetical protein
MMMTFQRIRAPPWTVLPRLKKEKTTWKWLGVNRVYLTDRGRILSGIFSVVDN